MLTASALREKILDNVLVTSCGCWVWLKSRLPSGYGQIGIGRQKQAYAHRVSHEVFNGDIPEGHVVMHSCDIPACCNPSHLSTGTQKDNMKDCSRKGRASNGGTQGTRNGRAKLTWETVREIRKDPGSNKELATRYGVTPELIGQVRRRIIWQDDHLTELADGARITKQPTAQV